MLPRDEVERSMSEDDEDKLFREAMRDVKRLPEATRVIETPKPPPQARFRRADEQAVLQESLMVPEDAALLGTGDEVGFRRPNVPEAILIKLRRGQYAVDAEIDLHGLNAAQAKNALREFIADAVARHMHCVRVIHGKGRRSGPRGPVLKNIVNHWLQRSNHVLAFGSARAVDGGSGALYVLLRQ
jgi:DNA-nicking Smr family endonuclease